ncbi:phycoerythrin alpha subunit [Guillardia theta CCMP2712]|uniref:Phycoerythrin alpha subunit n=2 Tax=Guillardia theta TaxID=55529 RepID=L1J5L2_GUITC|nr:phycoerythrin alpha subunit [Guillardia theta CCMP2712]EKX43370.1 phycoerythrin alpha subunit [Guillardia theta CCMP2712]|eukprot:XP_005830350.1 phycoerythrin alpha subunit [Guillardia theta CCMP2712]
MSRVIVSAMLVASAAAFAPSPFSVPSLRSSSSSSISMNMEGPRGVAPIITVFDHRGCKRGKADSEYQGALANGPEDEMLVKVAYKKVPLSAGFADKVLQQTLGTFGQAPAGAKKAQAKK